MNMKDEMGEARTDLLLWMVDIAEARLENISSKTKTVNLKFTKNTLKMWVDRVRNLFPDFED